VVKGIRMEDRFINNQRGIAHILLMLVIVLVVVGVGGYFLYRQFFSSGGKLGQKAPPPSGVVTITKTGFIPSTIAIKKGQSIIFMNKDSSAHKVAAAPYPSHNSLSSFNSKTQIAPSQNYTYTFTQSGTFNYQDDLNPFRLRGTIVVN